MAFSSVNFAFLADIEGGRVNDEKDKSVEIIVKPKWAAFALAAVASFLILAYIAGLIAKYLFGHAHVFGLIELFNLDSEQNVPAYFSTILIFLCSMLLCFIGVCQQKMGRPYLLWLILAAIFLFLSFDEVTGVHEKFGLWMKSAFHTPGIFNRAWWVMPYGIAALALLMGYLRFILELPRIMRRWTILAGALYVCGAIGFEILGSLYISQQGVKNLGYELLVVCEESLEMFGMVIFLYALLSYIETELKSPRIIVASMENSRWNRRA